MVQSLRQPQILEIARSEGRVLVEDLARRLEVTVQTIRKDLADLADQGRLERVHGGAILPSGTANIAWEERRLLNGAAKAAIARAAAALIPDSASVFLGIGTTSEALAHELLRRRGLLVLTNNMNIANILIANPDCEVVLAGGRVRHSDGALVGALTSQVLSQFKLDHAVIGCSALDLEGDLLDFDLQEVGVSQGILRQARQSMLVCDSSKLRRSAPVRIASLSGIGRVITEAPLPAPLARLCRDWGTEVLVAPV